VKEDLEALRREVSGFGKKLEALEGRITTLEAEVQAATSRL
jgi:predicted  nucleic acid-binding Zn-ribbon protein